jgi:hypothetical protein
VSPVIDRLTADFAKALPAEEQLGREAVPDYLSVSISGVDAVNHFFGPSSLESEDRVRQLTALLYGWFPGISGDLKYDFPGSGSSADVDAGDILDALQGVFMGIFLIQRGDWSLITDLIHPRGGGSEQLRG